MHGYLTGVCVYLQTDSLCNFLHQAIVDGAVGGSLPADGAGQHLPDVFPQ